MRFALGAVVGIIVGPFVWGVVEGSMPRSVHAKLVDKLLDIRDMVDAHATSLQQKIEEEKQ